jgi:hypothetical protein
MTFKSRARFIKQLIERVNGQKIPMLWNKSKKLKLYFLKQFILSFTSLNKVVISTYLFNNASIIPYDEF